MLYAQLATSPWPMFHHDLAHTGLSQYDTSANNGAQKWKFTNGGSIGDPVIGADGTIYVGCGANLCAVNPDGTQQWVFALSDGDSEVTDVPAIAADGTIYVGGVGYIYAVNPDGLQQWAGSYSTNGYTSPAIGADGTIHVMDQDKLLWIPATGLGIGSILLNTSTSPAIGSDGTVYATSSCGFGGPGYNLDAFPSGEYFWNWQTELSSLCVMVTLGLRADLFRGDDLYRSR